MYKFLLKLLYPLQFLLVVTYIIFEELIWEGVAKPIYTKIHALKILQKLERVMQTIPSFALLTVFLLLLILVQGAGLVAGALFVSGNFLLGVLLYLSKIPIAALTFWFFSVSKETFMSYGWFATFYGKLMTLIDWVKSRKMYTDILTKSKEIKASILSFKERFLQSDGVLVKRFRSLYKMFKQKS